MQYFFCGIGFLFLGGIVSLFFKERIKGIFFSCVNGLSFFCCFYFVLTVFFHGTQVYTLSYSQPIGDIQFVFDYLTAFFIGFISFFSFINSIYAIDYLKPYLFQKKGITSHYFFYTLLIISMLLVVSIQNALAFLIAWEIMSLSSFFLVIFENDKEEVTKSGTYYFVAMHISVVFLISVFAYLSIKTGSFSFESFREFLQLQKGDSFFVFVLFLIGFGIKAGIVPLHTWLPKAHPAAPTHISALMSGVMIKTGIYGILRVLTLLGDITPGMGYLVLGIGLFSAFYGIIYSTACKDLKQILAYSSIENIGIIMSGLGIGMLGIVFKNEAMIILSFSGALLHVFNHGLFKTLLFYGAGAVYQKTHTRNIEKLGGLAKFMPYTAGFFFIGAMAISALPPLNGFFSEFLIYIGIFNGLKIDDFLSIVMILAMGTLSLVGAVAVLSFTRLYGIIFQGHPRSELPGEKSEVSKKMLLPMLFNVLLMFLVVFFSQFIFPVLEQILNQLFHTPKSSETQDMLQMLSYSCLLFIGIILFLFLLKKLLTRKRESAHTGTWSCGYQAGTPRIQYTGSSYSNFFLTLTHFLFKKDIKGGTPESYFPGKSDFSMAFSDVFESYIIQPTIKTLNWF